ncbi:eukaryotic protein [Schizosaccharomyces japonicus yFS275]|uniref:ER membrane protein complex subunit 3 n=1 Tax=Schizosaccharomyces japonicus (strain yFS275 / FY16936) TaxID=402676 RepID=B6JZT7_SCHJY|nr:eukaryotic protein [Schizosaccharomyces japonicus yFS275]EEB06087.1 eukaryotic protein [Schizosaccharomyces japonicus yFS275]
MQDLLLDPVLRTWVLIPIFVIMILIGLLRHNLTILLRSKPKALDAKTLREQRIILRAANLRGNANNLLPDALEQRKAFFNNVLRSDEYLKDPASAGKPVNFLTDESALEGIVESMKGNMMMIVPQTIIMTWISEFFAGFILLKLPFPLTIRFKSIFQSGVATTDLPVQWVSSISWYFINLFGLKSVYSLLLGSDNAASEPANPAVGQILQPGQDPKKMMLSELESIHIIDHKCLLDSVESRILERYNA